MKTIVEWIAILFLALLVSAAFAGGRTTDMVYGPYDVEVLRVLDGDTVEVDVHVWPGLRQRVRVRLAGINAPEIHTRRACEKAAGIAAKERLEELLRQSASVYLDEVRLGKYAGRVLGRIIVDGTDAGEILLLEGLVVRYEGGRRAPWPCSDGG